MKRPALLTLSLVFFGLLAACHAQTAPAAPNATTALPTGTGGNSVSGVLKNARDLWPEGEIEIYAAVFSGEIGKGYYVLEPDLHPHSTLHKDNSFTLTGLPPAVYILLAGTNPEEAREVLDQQGEALIFEIADAQQIEMGEAFIAQ
jgi:hypothetical protein